MKLNRSILIRSILLISLIASLTVLSSRLQADTGSCGGVTITLPFNDVMGNPFFCQIAAAYFSGLTNGTSATTYSPTDNVTREQMAAFTTRTLDQSLKRGSKRAVAKKWWTPQDANSLTLTDVGSNPRLVGFDGTDLWVANIVSATVTRVRGNDGKLLETWTGATGAFAPLVAMGRVFITGNVGAGTPGQLYMIDPSQPEGAVTLITNSLGNNTLGLAFDGSRIWTANLGSVSIVTPGPTLPWVATTIPISGSGFNGILFDGTNIWASDFFRDRIVKFNPSGTISQSVPVGRFPEFAVFDGTNIWVPNTSANTVSVIRVSSGAVIATLAGNGLSGPQVAAFDGERILVTNTPGHSVSLWKAADLSPLGTISTGTGSAPFGACSDGLNFWITLQNTHKLARF